MRLLIIGATGGTGLQVTRQAVEGGHHVTAFVRSPQKLGPPHDRVTVRQGDPRSVAELQRFFPATTRWSPSWVRRGLDRQRSSALPPGAP